MPITLCLNLNASVRVHFFALQIFPNDWRMLIDIQSLIIVLNLVALLRWLSLLNRPAGPSIHNIVNLPRDVLDSIQVFFVILFALKSCLAVEPT